ncbi:MAG TPA: retroviral-like aspartic protease family protein [Vicinamibacterales bacterium]
MRECLLLSAAIVLVAMPRPSATSATPFQLGDQGGVIVPVMVNGAGPFRMLIDTGATHSAITEAVANAVNPTTVARSTVITPAGETVRSIVSIERLVVGPVVAADVRPSVVESGAFDPAGRIHGLIGQDVLARLRYTIDFRKKVVEWHDDSPGRAGTRLPLAFEHGRFLVSLKQAHSTLRLVPDSGAGGLVLFDAHGRVAFNNEEPRPTVTLSTAQGTRRGHHVRIRTLQVGDRTMRDVPAVNIERAKPHPAEGDGLLPLHLFERVTFDGPARVLILG